MQRKAVSGIVSILLLMGMLTLTINVQLSEEEEARFIKPDATGSDWLATTDWNKTYGGVGVEQANSVVQTSDGGYILAGYTNSYGAGNYDFWLIKTDSSGNKLWNKTYGGTNDDEACSVVQTSDRGYALAGFTNSFGAGGYDFWLVKLTPKTIYIRADGSVDPATAPIQRNGDLYTLTDNIYTSAIAGILIERNNMTLEGAGYKVQGTGSNYGILLPATGNNVTIKNTNIRNFEYGVAGNLTDFAVISRNNIANNLYGIWLGVSYNNCLVENNITTNSGYGIYLIYSNATIYHNNFINNMNQVYTHSSVNVWDNGYPSGGNYWSNYNGTDFYKGQGQGQPGSDGIGDQPYVIDASNADNYPFMEPSAFAYTPIGQNVSVTLTENATITFDQVTSGGFTSLMLRKTGPPPPSGTELIGPYYDIQTSASFNATVLIAITYDDTGLTQEQESALQLIQWDDRPVLGDINLDGTVDIFDLIKVAIVFGSKPGDSNWNPDADIKQDGVIDIFDLIKVAINFGKTWPVWVTATKGIDTVNNVIYAETDHLSIFGVRG